MCALGSLDGFFTDAKKDKNIFFPDNNMEKIKLDSRKGFGDSRLKEIEKISHKPFDNIQEKSFNKLSDKLIDDKNIKKIFNSYPLSPFSNSSNINKYGQTGLLSNFLLGQVAPENLIATLPEELKGKTELTGLSMHSRRVLLHVVSRLNTELFAESHQDFPILPKNKEEYCALMQGLAKAVSIESLPVSEQDIKNYYKAMKSLETILPDTDVSALELNLKMPREIFIKRVEAALGVLSEEEQRKVFDYFGFEIKDDKMSGYPVNIPDKTIDKDTNHATKQVIEGLRGLVDKFTQQNRINLPPEQKPLEDALNDIIKVFPEFLTAVGKKQHGTHKYSLDIHLLKVLQETMKNPEYKKLTDEEKKIFNIAALMHDVAKAEGEVDKSHPYESALDISYIVPKLKLPEGEQERIVNIVKNHHWLEELSRVDKSDTKTLKSIAFSFRKPHDFSIAKIFAEADLKGVSDEFFEAHKEVLCSEQIQKVAEYLDYIYQTGIYFPQTTIPEASELSVVPESLGEGDEKTNNVVLNLSKCGDLRQYGFDSSELKTFVHVFDDFDIGTPTLRALEKEINEGVLSTSYIDGEHYGTYYGKKFGVLLEADPANIIQAGNCNLTSGTKKGLKSSILGIFDSVDSVLGINSVKFHNPRTTFSLKVKSHLNLNDEEYGELFQNLILNPDFNLIPDKNTRQAISDVANSYMRSNDDHNEITVLAPKIKGIFAKNKKAEEIPYAIRKFAQDNDLPIIIFGNQTEI